MVSKTVQYTVSQNLCCGCGVCKGICPKDAISWERKDGLYLPRIDELKCVNCGLCIQVCPGLGHTYVTKETAVQTVTGTVTVCCNAWSKAPGLRHVSASGGVISTMIQYLLASGKYDGVFCLDSYDYREQLKTRLYTAEEVAAEWDKSNAPKSRYLPVSHENAVSYMRGHRNGKLILVGTSCAIRGLLAAVEKLNLNKEQYLFIGLFCDKVFNYNVLSYFADTYADGAMLKAMHFKNKESGGWPGNMKFFPDNADAFYVPMAARAKAKDYFMPERCLYCVDKLNVMADISLGDNYTGQDDSPLGSNSVIVRTEKGMAAWSAVQDLLEIRPVDICAIQKAQAIDWRLNNLYVGDLARTEDDLNKGVPREKDGSFYRNAYRTGLKKLKTGAVYDINPGAIKKQIKKDHKKPNAIIRFARRAAGYVKRNLKNILMWKT